MIIVEYDAFDGLAVRDGQAREWASFDVERTRYEDTVWRQYSTENIFNEFRILVKNKTISNQDIKFLFNQKYILINEDGTLNDWPKGFCDKIMEQLVILIAH